MGRYSTGSWTTKECKTVSIAFLKKHGYLQPGFKRAGTLSYSIEGKEAGSISITCEMGNDPFLLIQFTSTNKSTGEKKSIKQKVSLIKVASNLGKGFRYYMQCPYSFKRCEILYMAYGSNCFKHREAYKNRIYYPLQIESKLGLMFQYHNLDRLIEKLYQKKTKEHYKGIKTKLVQRIEKLESKSNHYHNLVENLLNSPAIFKGCKGYKKQFL